MTSVDRIQGLSGSLAIKVPCRVATTANITLNGLQTIDGVTVVAGDRVLVKDQTTGSENGIYSASTSDWSRTLDFDGSNDVVTGTTVGVTAGTAYAGYLFAVTTTGTITPGTTSIAFDSSVTAVAVAAALAAVAATTPPFGTLTGEALNFIRLNAAEDAMEFRTPAEVLADIGAQAYDVDTAKTDVAQTFTVSQRGTITTDNDGSFDQSVTNNFFCTPTGAVALTFTNHTAGQSGLILFVNGSDYDITAAATTHIAAADLTKLSTTGTYLIAYLDNGTNAYCTVTAALTSQGL